MTLKSSPAVRAGGLGSMLPRIDSLELNDLAQFALILRPHLLV